MSAQLHVDEHSVRALDRRCALLHSGKPRRRSQSWSAFCPSLFRLSNSRSQVAITGGRDFRQQNQGDPNSSELDPICGEGLLSSYVHFWATANGESLHRDLGPGLRVDCPQRIPNIH